MTRLFGCICNQPHRLDEALEGVRAVLVAQAPVARWGLGYVHSGEVLLTLHPRQTGGDVDFHGLLSGLNSDYVIGWASHEDKLRGDANTQPFRYRRWFFAQEGPSPTSELFGELHSQLVHHIPDYLRRNIRGRSPAEHVFHLFLSMLHDAGTLDDPNLASTHIRRALRDTVALIESLAARTGQSWPLGNVVLSNSRSMMGVRLAGPLVVRRLKQQKDPKRPESQFKAVLVVSSGADLRNENGFEELPPRSAVAISRDVSTDIVELES